MPKHDKAKLKELQRQIDRLETALDFAEEVIRDILQRLYALEHPRQRSEVTTQKLSG